MPEISKFFIEVILKRLANVQKDNLKIQQPRQYAAPTATACTPTFVNGSVGSRISNNRIWRRALEEDSVISLLLEVVANPVTGVSQTHIQPLDHVYRQLYGSSVQYLCSFMY